MCGFRGCRRAERREADCLWHVEEIKYTLSVGQEWKNGNPVKEAFPMPHRFRARGTQNHAHLCAGSARRLLANSLSTGHGILSDVPHEGYGGMRQGYG